MALPTVPALPDAERRTPFSLSNSAGPVSVGFALYGDGTDYQNWLQVYLGGVLQDPSTWKVTSATGPLGSIPLPITDAVITFSTAITGSGQIVGARRPRRLSQLDENQGVPARDQNVTISDLVAELREMWDMLHSRVLQAPPGETLPLLLPAAQRANQNLITDASGKITTGAPVGGGASVSTAMQGVLAAATTAIGLGFFGIFQTVAQAQTTVLSSSVGGVLTLGYATAGDDGTSLYKRLAGAPSPITLAHFQSADGAWWQLAPLGGIYRPEMFGAKADGVTDDAPAINAMFEYVPGGANCYFGPKYYRVKKQAGKNYGIRLRKAIRMIGTLGGGDPGNAALVYDNSFTSADDVFLIQPPGSDDGIGLITIYGLEIGGFYFVPFANSLGFVLTLFSWSPLTEYSLYAKDVIRFDVRSSVGATAIGRAWIHDLYVFGSGGLGGGQGTGFSINVDCDSLSAGMYSSRFERIHVSGGIRLAYVGDSNVLSDIRMDGKYGLDYLIAPGAVETVFENFNTSCLGPAAIGHWGSKITFRNWNTEAHGAQAAKGPDNAIFDIRNELLPNGAGNPCNGITFDGITVGDQTHTTGGDGTFYNTLIYLNNCIAAVFRRCNLYSSQLPATPTVNGIQLDANTSFTFLEGPFTRQATNVITNLVSDLGTGNYGVDQTGANANAPITMQGSWVNSGVKLRKHAGGMVSLQGPVTIGTFALGNVLQLPAGFLPDSSLPFVCATNATGTAGTCAVQVNSSGMLSVVAFSGTPTQFFLSGINFKEAKHDALVTIS